MPTMLENPVAAVADAPVDALLYGALVEEVADLNLRPAVDHPMRSFHPGEVPGQVEVDQPAAGLQVEALRQGVAP